MPSADDVGEVPNAGASSSVEVDLWASVKPYRVGKVIRVFRAKRVPMAVQKHCGEVLLLLLRHGFLHISLR